VSTRVARCGACGHLIALVNTDMMRGVVGLTYGWVHITRGGRYKRRRHVPVGPA
jgi:hypothetical protein